MLVAQNLLEVQSYLLWQAAVRAYLTSAMFFGDREKRSFKCLMLLYWIKIFIRTVSKEDIVGKRKKSRNSPIRHLIEHPVFSSLICRWPDHTSPLEKRLEADSIQRHLNHPRQLLAMSQCHGLFEKGTVSK